MKTEEQKSKDFVKQSEKKTRRFRAKIGESYAKLSFDFHEKGVLVKCGAVFQATIFKRNVDVGFAMERTRNLQKEIRESMHSEWKAFAPLAYNEAPTVEEFLVADLQLVAVGE
jgi:hypothetical protein